MLKFLLLYVVFAGETNVIVGETVSTVNDSALLPRLFALSLQYIWNELRPSLIEITELFLYAVSLIFSIVTFAAPFSEYEQLVNTSFALTVRLKFLLLYVGSPGIRMLWSVTTVSTV